MPKNLRNEQTLKREEIYSDIAVFFRKIRAFQGWNVTSEKT
jgi:hypothetical protein